MRSWATANLAWVTSSIRLCSAIASCCICSRSASESESTRINSGFMMTETTVPVFAFWGDVIVGSSLGVLGLGRWIFDAPHDHHPPFIPWCLIPPLFQPLLKLHMEPHWFLCFLRILGWDPWGGNTGMYCNTPVTLLTNFQLVLGHTVTPFTFQDPRNLCFVLELGCTPQWRYPPSCHTASGSSGSQKISSPNPISCYSLSLASCSCPTLHSCVSIHVTSHSCVSCSHFWYPWPNALLPILVYKTPAYVCIRHVRTSTWFLSSLSTRPTLWFRTLIPYFWNNSSFYLNSMLNLF